MVLVNDSNRQRKVDLRHFPVIPPLRHWGRFDHVVSCFLQYKNMGPERPRRHSFYPLRSPALLMTLIMLHPPTSPSPDPPPPPHNPQRIWRVGYLLLVGPAAFLETLLKVTYEVRPQVLLRNDLSLAFAAHQKQAASTTK